MSRTSSLAITSERHFVYKTLFSVALWLLWSTLGFQSPALAQAQGDSSTAAEKDRIVDCKLPEQVRKLDARRTQLMPGRVEKLSQAECESRGGSPVATTGSESENP
jgi:hypothetical protein